MLVAGLSSGLRNDAPDGAIAMRQRWRLAELRCEDYAFTLMSRYINALTENGTLGAMREGGQAAWARPLGALVLGVRQCGLSSWMPSECFAIDEDIGCWQRLGVSSSKVYIHTKCCVLGVEVVGDAHTGGTLRATAASCACDHNTACHLWGSSNNPYGVRCCC